MQTVLQSLRVAAVLIISMCARAEGTTETFSIDSARGIDERVYLEINGVPQYVMIRGEDRDNPVLLYVHGGPGAAASLYAWKYFTRGGWERSFTVVNWDQQGAGKTFGRAGNKIDPTLTIERLVEDGVAVAEAVARKLGKRKIILAGGSWGSVIGARMAKQRPDLFYAYVGNAHVVSPYDEVIAYRRVLDKARSKGIAAAVAELEKAGPPPYRSPEAFRVQRKWAGIFEKHPRVDIQKEVASTPGTVPADLAIWGAGFLASDAHFRGADMQGPAESIDLTTWGPEFKLPVIIIQGAEDDVTPTDEVRKYFEWIQAPTKRFLVIDGAGHNVVTSHSEAFGKLLAQHARPLAMAQ
jgi:pimeloyl-ACP methyl ester carboxylesterase